MGDRDAVGNWLVLHSLAFHLPDRHAGGGQHETDCEEHGSKEKFATAGGGTVRCSAHDFLAVASPIVPRGLSSLIVHAFRGLGAFLRRRIEPRADVVGDPFQPVVADSLDVDGGHGRIGVAHDEVAGPLVACLVGDGAVRV